MRAPTCLHLLYHGLKLSCVTLERIEPKFWAIAVLHADVLDPGLSWLGFVLEKRDLHGCLDVAESIWIVLIKNSRDSGVAKQCIVAFDTCAP